MVAKSAYDTWLEELPSSWEGLGCSGRGGAYKGLELHFERSLRLNKFNFVMV